MKRKLPVSQPKREALSHQVFSPNYFNFTFQRADNSSLTVCNLQPVHLCGLAGGMFTRRLFSRSSRGHTFGFLVSRVHSFCREIKAHNSPRPFANEKFQTFCTFLFKKNQQQSKVVVPCSIASESLTQTFRNLFDGVFSAQ
jgi:hypothetical protein